MSVTLDSVELWHSARLRPSLLWRYRVWKKGHAHALFKARASDRYQHPPSDECHLQLAAAWLARAHDATTDGGVVGRYLLDRGWTSSYPETTGYIVPTFLALGRTQDPGYIGRARRCVDFLLSTQLASGAFPAGEVADNVTIPSPFNTAQIIHGLLSWHRHQPDDAALTAACRAGEWLTSIQEADGAWRRWAFNNVPASYSAYLSCWLADLGTACDDRRFLDSAARHVDWLLRHRCEQTGWIERCGFTMEQHALRIADLHTIGYALAGLLRTATILKRPDVLNVVIVASREIAAVLKRLGWLPGVMDWRWRARADSACLTGNAQMALVWMSLRDETSDDSWLEPAYIALDLVKRAQLLDSPNPSLLGGIPGADPLWGWYNGGAFLSWSTKFFIDAMLRKAEIEATRCRE